LLDSVKGGGPLQQHLQDGSAYSLSAFAGCHIDAPDASLVTRLKPLLAIESRCSDQLLAIEGAYDERILRIGPQSRPNLNQAKTTVFLSR
jgi:hypothetical protein